MKINLGLVISKNMFDRCFNSSCRFSSFFVHLHQLLWCFFLYEFLTADLTQEHCKPNLYPTLLTCRYNVSFSRCQLQGALFFLEEVSVKLSVKLCNVAQWLLEHVSSCIRELFFNNSTPVSKYTINCLKWPIFWTHHSILRLENVKLFSR